MNIKQGFAEKIYTEMLKRVEAEFTADDLKSLAKVVRPAKVPASPTGKIQWQAARLIIDPTVYNRQVATEFISSAIMMKPINQAMDLLNNDNPITNWLDKFETRLKIDDLIDNKYLEICHELIKNAIEKIKKGKTNA